MRQFKAFFLLETKRFFFTPRNAVIILLLFILSLIFVQIGIHQYNQSIQLKQKFQEIEKEKVKQFKTYTQYGTYGFRMLFFPDPISVFFNNSGVIRGMTAYVDSGERLKIYLPLKGKNVFSLANKGFTDFSGVILFFGSLLALLFGLDSLINEEYLKFLSSFTRANHVFLSLLLARIILVFLLFLLLFCSALILIYLNGVCLQINLHFLYFFLVIVLISFFFFALGTVFSTFKSKIAGFIYAICSWFILIFILPGVINAVVEGKAANITPVYQLEMEKLKIVMDFEGWAIETAGTFKKGIKVEDKHRKVISSYFENEFVEIHALEKKMIDQMRENISLLHKISIFFPSTFHLSVKNEISSNGYSNLIQFYKAVQALKKKFFIFYMKKLYYTNYPKQVEYFHTDEGNVFYADSQFSEYFIWGIMITLFHISYLLGIAYSRFKKNLYQLPDVVPNNQPTPRVKLAKNDFKVWSTKANLFKRQLFNLFSGISKKPGKKKTIPPFELFIDNQPLSPGNKKQSFLYLCLLCHLPNDVKVGDFLCFLQVLMNVPADTTESPAASWTSKTYPLKKIKQLDDHELGQLALYILEMKPHDIYLIDNIAVGMPAEFVIQLNEKMKALKTGGGLVFYIASNNTDITFWKNKEKPSRYFWEDSNWTKQVDSMKEARKSETTEHTENTDESG